MGRQPFIMSAHSCAIARFARSGFFPSSSWGSASLHPRLYASTRCAGFVIHLKLTHYPSQLSLLLNVWFQVTWPKIILQGK
jgi:hypothetical protein